MAQSLLTKESPEIRQFFRNIDTLSRLLDIQAEKVPSATERRPLHDGQRACRKTETDTKDTGRLPPERKNTLLQDRRQIIVQGERCPGIAGKQSDGSVRLNPVPPLPTGRLLFSMADRHSYRISILTCKGRLLPCTITAKSKPGHIRNGNTGFCQAGHV